jgi:polyisoprenoid-binding protein YceI
MNSWTFAGLALVAGLASADRGPASALRTHPQGAVVAAVGDSGKLRLVPATGGNEARYRVREQLARLPLPSDAVGATSAVTGAIVLEDGHLVPSESKVVVDLASLRSDRDRRDNYVRTRTLETDQYPTATLVPSRIEGLPSPVPGTGDLHFTLVGDLTIHGATHPTTWQVQARAGADGYTGTASTSFTFADFGLTQPRVGFVLSVADTIRLEYDFHLVPEPPAGP